MENKKPEFMEYKGLPLVRENDCICYGDPSQKYILMINILAKNEKGEPNVFLIQICQTENTTKIEKQTFKEGTNLLDALDLGATWLEGMLKES